MPLFSHTGWSSSTVGPRGLESRRITAAPTVTPEPLALGPATALAATAALPQNITGLSPVNPSLASRRTGGVGPQQVAIQTSPYRTQNVPAFLNQAISDLNLNQSLRRSQHAELVNRLFQEAMTGNLSAWDALRAASLQPGVHAQLAPITDPNTGIAAAEQSRAAAGQLAAQTAAIRAAQAIPQQISTLEAQQARLGSAPFGFYQGSAQQRLNTQLTDLYGQRTARSSVQQLGQAAARSGSGWLSNPTLR